MTLIKWQFPSSPKKHSKTFQKHSKGSDLQHVFHLKNQISDDWRVQLKQTLCPGCFYHWGVGWFYCPGLKGLWKFVKFVRLVFDLWESDHFTNHLSSQKWIKTMKTFTTQNSVKNSTRSQRIASPGVNSQRSHQLKRMPSGTSAVPSDMTGIASQKTWVLYGFIVSVFTMTFPWKISISTIRASDTCWRKITGHTLASSSSQRVGEKIAFLIFFQNYANQTENLKKKQLENHITAKIELLSCHSRKRCHDRPRNLLRSTFKKKHWNRVSFQQIDAKLWRANSVRASFAPILSTIMQVHAQM